MLLKAIVYLQQFPLISKTFARFGARNWLENHWFKICGLTESDLYVEDFIL